VSSRKPGWTTFPLEGRQVRRCRSAQGRSGGLSYTGQSGYECMPTTFVRRTGAPSADPYRWCCDQARSERGGIRNAGSCLPEVSRPSNKRKHYSQRDADIAAWRARLWPIPIGCESGNGHGEDVRRCPTQIIARLWISASTGTCKLGIESNSTTGNKLARMAPRLLAPHLAANSTDSEVMRD